MIDTRENLLTTILAGLTGLLVLLGLALLVVFGRVSVDRVAPSGDTSVPSVAVASAESGLEPLEEYAEIVRRPVFFSDRRLPVLEVAGVDEDLMPEPEVEEEVDEEPVPDLKATVAGIVITPDLRMAMINDQEVNRTVVLREGMSLEGEQAAWRLDRISARQVDFVSADGQRTNLELKVNTRGLTAPRLRQRSRDADVESEEAPANGEDERAELDDEARSRAEEIRRRVADRRAELRAEAERRAQEQQDNR